MPTKAVRADSSCTPIFVIAGFLGSGKTTLLKRVLAHELDRGVKPAVLMNEFGEIDVDGALLRRAGEPRGLCGGLRNRRGRSLSHRAWAVCAAGWRLPCGGSPG